MIRKAVENDLSRIAEILVFDKRRFDKRVKYRSIFHDDIYAFVTLQVLPVARQYAEPDFLHPIWVWDDGIVKGMIPY